MRIQLLLSLHYYLLYLLLNSCDRNNAFWCHSMLVNSPIHSANTEFYLIRSVSTKQSWPKPDWLQNLGMCVHRTRHLSATPTPWSSASLTRTWVIMSQNVIDEAHRQWRKRLRTCMKAKWHHFEHLLKPALFRAANSLPRKTRCFASFPSQLFKIKLDAGMWRYHANRMDARRSQFDLGRVDAYN